MALYTFVDTIELAPGATALPAEALKYAGTWIDSAVPGFRTLYVSGRESFAYEVSDLKLETMDGSVFLRRRLAPRTIRVGYQLAAASAAAFRSAFNTLAFLMSGQQAEVAFADETDKYFTGTCVSLGQPEPGRLGVTSEIEIYCADPLKYAVSETVVRPTVRSGTAYFNFTYEGTAPVRPRFHVSFTSDTKLVTFRETVYGDGVVKAGDADAEYYYFDEIDTAVIDCTACGIYMNGYRYNDVAAGDIANDYENMVIHPGSNGFQATYYAPGGTMPEFELRYRGAWL